MSEPKKIVFAHETWLSEEANFIKDHPLPKELKKIISSWNMQKKRYDNKPTDTFAESLQRQSVEIADKLQTWQESEEGRQETPPTEPAAVTPPPPAEPPAAPAPTPAPEPTPEEKLALERETQVETILKKEGRIHNTDLSKILGTKNYGAVVQVGKFRLRRRLFYYYES